MTSAESLGPAVVVAAVSASSIRGALVDASGSMLATKEGITPQTSADDLVLLGGELAEAAGPMLITAPRAELEARLSVVPSPELRTAALGESAGRLGSAFERVGMGRGFSAREPVH